MGKYEQVRLKRKKRMQGELRKEGRSAVMGKVRASEL